MEKKITIPTEVRFYLFRLDELLELHEFITTNPSLKYSTVPVVYFLSTVNHLIFGCYTQLREQGFGEEALRMIEIRKQIKRA